MNNKHLVETTLSYDRWLSRRDFLGIMGTGLGSIALSAILAEQAAGQTPPRIGGLGGENPLAPHPGHFAPKAKRVIQIFCPGAVSQMDTWEYKPELQKRHGEPLPGLSGQSS